MLGIHRAEPMLCPVNSVLVGCVGTITNTSVLAEVKIKMRLSTTCLRRSYEIFGHIARKEGDNLEKTFMTRRKDGQRPRGRSPLRWSDQNPHDT
ncbi:unnamed protein product [Diatraea saccharalis]|uniref:Uncharacterized protein n=1 Tax=Diatraea saccharalis TaxID=40085 RepID=A0A9N9R451_9NEOP|nr:unnamed protein product [Diatraea saccharalis]